MKNFRAVAFAFIALFSAHCRATSLQFEMEDVTNNIRKSKIVPTSPPPYNARRTRNNTEIVNAHQASIAFVPKSSKSINVRKVEAPKKSTTPKLTSNGNVPKAIKTTKRTLSGKKSSVPVASKDDKAAGVVSDYDISQPGDCLTSEIDLLFGYSDFEAPSV